MPYICKCCGTHQPGQSDGWCGLPTCRAAAALAKQVQVVDDTPSASAPSPDPTLTNAELLALIPDGGRYEVREVLEEHVCLLLLSAGDSLTAAKLTSEQALHLSTLLVRAAMRLEPALASRSGIEAKCLHRGTVVPAPGGFGGSVCTACGLYFPNFTPSGAGGGEAPR